MQLAHIPLLKSAYCRARSFCDSDKLCGRPPRYAPATCKLTFDLLTLKVVSESRVTWATSVPILVFLCLSVLELGTMYATDRQTDVRQTSDAHRRLMSRYGAGYDNRISIASYDRNLRGAGGKSDQCSVKA